ncbi:MAG: polymer-forming cytoskeletal protein [Gammaproteobacteria bacterium]
MLGRQNKNQTEAETVIGAGTRLQGDIEFNRRLQLDGTVIGNIKAVGDNFSVLSISDKGVVEGTITVPYLSLDGTVVGDIHVSERLELTAKARVIGNIRYKLIKIALGSEINGKIVHESEESNERPVRVANAKIGAVPPLKSSGE